MTHGTASFIMGQTGHEFPWETPCLCLIIVQRETQWLVLLENLGLVLHLGGDGGLGRWCHHNCYVPVLPLECAAGLCGPVWPPFRAGTLSSAGEQGNSESHKVG